MWQANDDEYLAAFSLRWRVSAARLKRWYKISDVQLAVQLAVGERGAQLRMRTGDKARKPIRGGVAAYAAARGVTVAQLETETGLTRRTFNRLAKSNNTHRVRDLVAGVAVLLAARAQERQV